MKWTEEYEPVKVPALGIKYHCKWAHNGGIVGVCCKVDYPYVELIRPKERTKFAKLVHVRDLLHLRKRSIRLREGRTTEEEENKTYDCSKILWKRIQQWNKVEDKISTHG